MMCRLICKRKNDRGNLLFLFKKLNKKKAAEWVYNINKISA